MHPPYYKSVSDHRMYKIAFEMFAHQHLKRAV